ncbi:MFS transporter, partial [uncultured Brevibacterium sp.]|uniref:MFS transporter n=1 Tax=uncultured Brevibacterium sp. TaxID=189678 RepID=UPI0025FC8AFA
MNQPVAPAEVVAEKGGMSPGAVKALVASIAGTLIEWYDYALYGAAAGLVIAPLFFPGHLSAAAGLSTFATFAVGFLARPLGGLVIGHIGDRYGRKPAMLLTIILMAVATVGIGLLPTAHTIGVFAPILLVLFRFIQGFGAGAELTGAITVVAEYTSPKRRGWFTGFILSMPPLGIVLATGAFLWASHLPEDTFLSWGWRLPFLASALLFFVALYIRAQLEETPEYVASQEIAEKQQAENKVPIKELLRTDLKGVLLGFFGMFGHSALVYLIASFSVFYLTSPYVGMSRSDALVAVTVGSLVAVVTTPFAGWAS